MNAAGRRPRAFAAAVIGAVWAAGCAPAAPGPSSPLTDPSASAPPASATPASVTPVPSATPVSELRAELRVMALDRAFTDTILEFASEGTSIVVSSGAAGDAAAGTAPDLWEIDADAVDPEPVLRWRNPERDHSIVRVGGAVRSFAFVDIPTDGTEAWNLWVLPRDHDDAILLDTHPGDAEVSSLVPSFTVQENFIAWTAFDMGGRGPVTQLLWARAPDWVPTVLLERPADEYELWLPSADGPRLVFSEIHYSPDRSTHTRGVYYLDLSDPGAEPERLDRTDRATMGLLLHDTVIWKETDPGFSMFNWGRLVRHDLGGPGSRAIDTAPQEYVNYPSVGARFVAWWGANSFEFGVYDLLEDRPRLIESHPAASQASVLRPHINGDLLVWLHVEGPETDAFGELRWAFMPPVRAPR